MHRYLYIPSCSINLIASRLRAPVSAMLMVCVVMEIPDFREDTRAPMEPDEVVQRFRSLNNHCI